MKTTKEGPPPPKPAILDKPAINAIRTDPMKVYNEGGNR